MRVQPRPAKACPWYLRPFLWNQRRKYGEVLTAALVWARVPRLFLGVAVLYGMIDHRRSPVPPALRSLLTVRVSQLNHCHFCIDLNARTMLRRGISEEKALALAQWRDSPLFDARERAALGWAEAVTTGGGDVPAELLAEVRRHFDGDALVELTALIAFQNMSSKFNAALGVPAQGFCPLPLGGGTSRSPTK